MAVVNPKKVPKGWGYELWIANNEQYCGKILHIKDKKKCSDHFHLVKHETFYIIKGIVMMKIRYKDGTRENFLMKKEDVLEVPPGLMHQLEAIDGDADIMEVSTTHRDEDSYRVKRGD